jgi:hypothetical protein
LQQCAGPIDDDFLAFSPDSKQVAASSTDTTVWLGDTGTSRAQASLP